MLKPYEFQQTIIDRFAPLDHAALFMDTGTGKTLTAINILRAKWAKHQAALRTVIFCPIITLENWRDELLMNTKLDVQYIEVITASDSKRRVKQIEAAKNKYIIIINYDALRNVEVRQALENWRALCAIADESHEIKTHNSQRLTNAVQVTQYAKYKQLLTATPMTNNPADIWGQYYFLDKGATFGPKFYKFRRAWFENVNAGWQDVQGHKGEKSFAKWDFKETLKTQFQKTLAAKSVFVKKEDCLDLPDVVEQTVKIPITSEQQKHYTEVKNNLITWIENQEDNPLVIKNALVKMLRLNELLCGYMKLEDGTIKKFDKNPRLDALIEKIKQVQPYKVIVFTVFRQTYQDIERALAKEKIKFVTISGEQSTKEKLENVAAFNDFNSGVRVCIANPQSGGVGINMKSAPYIVFYSRDFSKKNYLQAIGRNYRAGSIDLFKKITRFNFVAPDTIDEYIAEKVQSDIENINSILDIKRLLVDS